tara:strand:+ start:70 stop:657 length:588 start_codon:yes stop_codon:yes gene_type:complete
MAGIKPILTGIVGLIFLASLIGYSGENIIDNVPKPDVGLCGVTKDSYSDVPGSGALLDIDVNVAWDDDTVWIGIIDVKTYDSLEKLGGNSDGEIVPCESKIDFLAGGPDFGNDSEFSWNPDGNEFHIMIGSMQEADDDDDDDGSPFPFDGTISSQTFVDDFTVTVNYNASGGWGLILFLLILELGLVYFTTLEMR